MSAADACAAILLVGVILYALFAGADFGAGFWDLIAGGDVRGRRPGRSSTAPSRPSGRRTTSG